MSSALAVTVGSHGVYRTQPTLVRCGGHLLRFDGTVLDDILLDNLHPPVLSYVLRNLHIIHDT